MGGAVQKVGQAIGVDKKPQAPEMPMAEAAENVSRASAMDEMMGARMRGARRRGRQLLSDARLNAESGVETLGGGQSLG
jgi:hypothetical protein